MPNKNKVILIIIPIIILIILFLLLNNKKTSISPKNDNNTNNNETNKSVVLYFSVTHNTETIAKYISKITKSDIIEIKPEKEYNNADINYSNEDSRATKEQKDDKARPKIKNKLDIAKYNNIYLGYPIWWGDVPKIILTLIDNYELKDKTIIPFCTSGSTDISNSVNTIRNYNNNLNILDGKRFSSTSTKKEVEEWINSINIKN